MNRVVLFAFCTLLISCGSVTEEKLSLLNGYWEIQEVEFPNGGKKEYKINSNVDYIKLDNLKGYRKKVNPRFDGSFETSDDAEFFTIIANNNSYSIKYENDLSSWEETLVSLSDDSFAIKNAEGTIYKYKRFKPINISD